MRYAYLGPTGTFTEAALLQVADPQIDEFVPMPGVPAVLEAVRAAEGGRGMVPSEGAVEGGVSATLDALSSGQPLVVVGETVVQVQFVLVARPGTTLKEVDRISTHPHAWAQCRPWLGRHLPQPTHLPAPSDGARGAPLT